jgi:hypothetical protein
MSGCGPLLGQARLSLSGEPLGSPLSQRPGSHLSRLLQESDTRVFGESGPQRG